MAHRRGSFRGRGGISESQRRKKDWVNMNPAVALGEDLAGGALKPADLVAPGDSTAILAFPSLLNPTFAESTVLRIRGYLEVPKSLVSSVLGSATTVYAFGIGIVTDQAASVVGAVPNPATVSGQDWDGWMFLRSSNQALVDVTGTIVDIKAMRKWQSGDALVFVAGMATSLPAGDLGLIFSFNFRTLLLLP